MKLHTLNQKIKTQKRKIKKRHNGYNAQRINDKKRERKYKKLIGGKE